MRDALFFSKLRVLLCGWRWKQHRRASWLKARLRRLRRFTRRLSIDPLRSSLITPHASRFVLEPLESRLLLAADLTGLVQSAALIDPAVPTNNASAVVQVQNVGNQSVNQSQVGVYASLDTTLDASDVLLGTANTGQVNAGQSKNVTVNLTIPNTLDPIAYRLLAKLDNANAIAENSETNNVAVGGTVNVAWKFGTVPGRSGNTTLTLRDADGTRVTFSLSGPGLGEVIRDGANWDVKVTGTTASSTLTILTNSGGNGRVTLNDIHVFGPLASLTAATTDLTGTLAIDGPVNIPGLLPGTITLGSIQGGTVAVPSVEALTILGSTTNAKFYIGTTLGQDGQPGGTGANADTYGAGKIGLFTVTGAMSGTSVRVGINPVDGVYGNGNDQLIGGTGSSIGGIIIGGALSADTRFYAGTFPTQYLHGLTLKPTAGDFHFISNFSGPSLSAALQQDSGGSAIDQLTNNPAITGSVTDPQGIATFVAGFGATPTVNVLSDRQPNGSFTFTPARLEQINGGLLTDGSYSLKLAATDSAGNSTQITVSFTLDTQVPVLTLDLDPASDTAPVGDQQTTNAIVTLVGQTEANAPVELLGLGVQTTANGTGAFSFNNVSLALGANSFTVRATDAAGNQRTEIRTITRVAVGNGAPVLNPISSQTVNEGAALTFTAAATDGDLPVQTLTFSLANGATGLVPAGASIDPTTGVFTWTPTEAQGPGTYTFDVVISDGIATDFETIQVTVSEVNLAPTVAAVANQTLDEATTLTLTLSATDVDLPANTLTWSLPTAPVGATIDPTTGVFTWTPTEAQGPGLFTVTARATDNGSPSLFGETTFTVTVNEVNLAPVLASIPAQTVTAGQLLSFTAAGSDADLPVNTLTYSLEGTVPAGATINATTGVFTWTPTVSQVGPQTVTVRLTDNGSPAMFAEQVVSITVAASNLAPVLGAIGNQTVNEGEPVTFTATATDADIPAQGLTFSLEGTVPPGAAIDPTTGLFTWTPTEAQGAGAYTFDVVVTDNGTPTLSDRETITITVNEINQAPVLAPIGNQIVNEGTELRFTLSASDPDLPGQALVFGASGLPTGATFNTATREFVWTPSESQGPGTYNVTFSVTDEFATATETMTITVNEVNVAPVLDPIGNKSVIEETELRFTIGASDVDVPVQTLVYSATGLPAGATFDPATREFVWTPTDTQGPNTYDMTFSVTDGVVTTSETITITVNEVNQAPVLTLVGNQTVSEGQLLSFTATATDTDVPVQQLTFSLANGATGQVPGGASITAAGLFTWTPTEAQGPGTYTFDVVVSDGTLSDSETITITVNEVNLAPVLNLIGNQIVNEGQPLTFTAAATDADLLVQTLTFSLANGATGQVPVGASIDPTTGVFTWTPTEAQGPGTYTFDVVVTDNGTPVLSDSETITVTVNEGNQTPTFTSSPTVSVQENQTQVMTVTASDTDVPVQPLIYSLAGGADVAAFAITSGGALSFQAAPNFEAPTDANLDNVYEVTVQVSDGVGGIATQAVQVTVTNVVENIPAISINDITQAEGTSLAGFTAFNFTVTLSSPTTDIVTVQVATQDLDATAASGDYQAVPLTTLTFGPGETTKTVTVQVRQDDLQEGTEQFRVLLSGATNATITDSTGVGTITNDDINTLSIDDATVTEGDSGTSTANFTVTLSQQPTSNVTVQVATANGTATAGSDYLAISPAQTLTFTPTGPLSQTVSVTVNGDMQLEPDETFTVNLSNAVGAAIGTATGTGTILNDDFAPVLDAIGAQTVNEGEPLTFTATATDANAGQTLTFSLANGATGQVPVSASIDPTTGVFTWTPTEAQGPGTHTFDVVVSDGTLIDSETITVTVNEVNQAPTLAAIPNQTVTVGQVLTFTTVGTDTDLPSNALTYSLQGVFSAGATIDPTTGVFTWTPTPAQVGGPHGFTVRVTDNGTPNLFAEQIVQVTVEPRPNQAPVLNLIGNQTIDEGQQLTFFANATDPDGLTTFTFSLDNGLSGQVPAGASIDALGGFVWTPTEAQGPGTYTFDVVVTDNGTPALSDRETITVTVNEVNQAPSLQAIPNQTVTAGQLLTFTAVGTDPDIPANSLTYSLDLSLLPPGFGALNTPTIDPITGVFNWTPAEGQVGTHQITVRVTDNGTSTLFAEQPFQVTVAASNQAPVLNPIGSQTVTVGQLLTFNATATDSDVPAQQLTFSLQGTPPSEANITAGGVFTWTPPAGQVGAHSVTIRVADNGAPALFDEETITITVAADLAVSFQGLGDLPGGTFSSVALSVSADGSVVVGQGVSASGNEAFRWTSGGGMVGLGDLPGGGFQSVAYGVSADGEVVVGTGRPGPLVSVDEAFIWTSGGGMVGLGVLPGGNSSRANSVSADGSVVVGQGVSASGNEAFRWTSGDGMVGLGDLPGGFFGSEATAVSADGNVVVGSGTSASGREAFRWMSGSGMVGLGDLPGGFFFSQAKGVSADGNVVVGESSSAAGPEAFRWTSSGGMVGLGDLPGPEFESEFVQEFQSTALGVSADGSRVVGRSQGFGNAISGGLFVITREAFLWDATNGMRSLTGLIVGDLGLAPGWTLFEATGISADGRVIVGWGENPLGQIEAWRLVLPDVLPTPGNEAPVLNPIGDRSVNEGATLTFTASAADSSASQTLHYRLAGAVPAGAGIDPITGAFFWTPTEAQGPGTYTFDVGVRDNSATSLSDSETITVTVNEANQAPTLVAIPNPNVTAGQLISFTAVGSDMDLPVNTLTYSLQGTVPAGAAINPTTGVFAWTPTVGQAGSYSVTVRVMDNGSPALFAERTVVLVVQGDPVLDVIGDRSVDEGSQLTFTATASDPNVGQTQTFTLQGSVPSGASITTGGVFTWTPTEAQGPGTYQVTVRVSDNGTPVLFDEETISISVGELNQAPVLTLIADQTVTEGQIVTFFASATDADVPLNQLTFSLEGTVPAGASIDPQTGQFAWITAAGQAGGYSFTVRVTDNGTPTLFSEQAVNVTVLSNAASFQGLGDLPGGLFSSRSFGVSGNGAVVVGESEGASGPEPFRWTVGGGIENFATLVGSPVTAVRAASFDGSVIVGSGLAGVFRWSQTDGLQTIVGTVGGYSGNAVSSDGSVVVGKGQIDIFTPGGAFRWTSATGAVHLDTLPGYLNAEAFAVSAAGNVVVGASYFGPSGEQEQAVRWVADGFGGFTVEALGDLPGGNFMSRALAVSADGTVIVGVSESDLGPEAFRWTATEGMQRLGDGTFGGPIGVSADGSVIVGGNQGNAFIWDANNGVRNLEGVLFDLGVPGMDGWSGLNAVGISADGRTIVGEGTNPQGDQEAYRAVLPENLFAPQYTGPTSFSGQADSLINFRLNLSAPDVSDQDSATQQFQVRLIGNVPAGVTLDPFGFFSWTPTTSDIGAHQLTVRLYDNGVPSRFSEFQLEVTVTA